MTKLNIEKINEYAEKFAYEACKAFFVENKTHLKSDDIENFTRISQVNYFMLEEIHSIWAEDKKSIHWAHFDNESVEVKVAFEQYFNILSRYAHIEKAFAEKLLVKAVQKTMLILLSPSVFFQNLINTLPDNFHLLKDLSKDLKFIITHVHLKERIFELLKSAASADASISKSTALLALESAIVQNKDYDDPKFILRALNDVFEIDFDSLTIENPLNIDKSFDERETNEATDTPIKVEDENVKQNLIPTEEIELDMSNIGDLDLTHEDSNRVFVPIKSLIPSEKEFGFIKVLFSDDRSEYNQALADLDTKNNYHDAIMYIKDNYFRKNSWDLEQNEVKEFYEILSEKY